LSIRAKQLSFGLIVTLLHDANQKLSLGAERRCVVAFCFG
jgi:hypothetical protein